MKINYILNNNIITGYTIIPFDDTKPYIEVTEDELKQIKVGYTQLINNKLVFNEDTYQTIKEAQKELATIKQWFKDNDWKVNKVVIGEWTTTDSRWLDYLSERTIKRTRQDELNEIIKGDTSL